MTGFLIIQYRTEFVTYLARQLLYLFERFVSCFASQSVSVVRNEVSDTVSHVILRRLHRPFLLQSCLFLWRRTEVLPRSRTSLNSDLPYRFVIGPLPLPWFLMRNNFFLCSDGADIPCDRFHAVLNCFLLPKTPSCLKSPSWIVNL